MNSPILALFNRTLRQESRSLIAYGCRGILLVPVLLFVFFMSMSPVNAPGLRLMNVFASVNLLVVVIVGVGYFPRMFIEEKDSGNLELLRISNLSSLAIILGKAIPPVLLVMLLMLIQLPFMMLAIALGGVSVKMILTSFSSLSASLIVLNGLGIFFSLIFKKSGSAIIATIVFLLLSGIVGGVFIHLLVPFFIQHGFITIAKILTIVGKGLIYIAWPLNSLWFVFLNELCYLFQFYLGSNLVLKVYRFLVVGRIGFVLRDSLVLQLCIGVMFWFISWLGLESFVNRSSSGEKRKIMAGDKVSNRRLRLKEVFDCGRSWIKGIAWKDFYFSYAGKKLVVIKLTFFVLATAILIELFCKTSHSDSWQVAVISIAGVLIMAIVLLIFLQTTIMFSFMVAKERREKTLSSVLLLPHGKLGFFVQKVKGCFVALLPDIFFFLFCFSSFLYCAESDDMSRFIKNIGFDHLGVILFYLLLYFSISCWFLLVSLYIKHLSFIVATGSLLMFWFVGLKVVPRVLGIYIEKVKYSGNSYAFVTAFVLGLLVWQIFRRMDYLASEN